MPRRNQNTESQNPVEDREQQVAATDAANETVTENTTPTETAPENEVSTALEEGAASHALPECQEETAAASVSEGEAPVPVSEEGVSTEEVQASPLPALEIRIHEQYSQDDIRATAEVKIGDLCTIRNVKVKEGDYGLEVVMPRTKMPESGRFKDSCYFDSIEAREQFDSAVLNAFQQVMQPVTHTEAYESDYDDMDYEEMDDGMTDGMDGMHF